LKNKIKIENLKKGDVIRASIPTKGEHSVIVLEDFKAGEHVKCIYSCTFSSNPSQKKDIRFISLDGLSIPDEIFSVKKETTYLRIDEPICLKKFEIRSKQCSLIDFPDLWEKICESLSTLSAEPAHELKGICSCKCLEEVIFPPFYCFMEISKLPNEDLDHYKTFDIIASCPCCGIIINTTGKAEKCNCGDNLVVMLSDFKNNRPQIAPLDQ